MAKIIRYMPGVFVRPPKIWVAKDLKTIRVRALEGLGNSVEPWLFVDGCCAVAYELDGMGTSQIVVVGNGDR